MHSLTEANLKALAGARSFDSPGLGYLDAVTGVEAGAGERPRHGAIWVELTQRENLPR